MAGVDAAKPSVALVELRIEERGVAVGPGPPMQVSRPFSIMSANCAAHASNAPFSAAPYSARSTADPKQQARGSRASCEARSPAGASVAFNVLISANRADASPKIEDGRVDPDSL
jgi:hypothetical protein